MKLENLILILIACVTIGCTSDVQPTQPESVTGGEKSICGIPGQCFECRQRVTCTNVWPHVGQPHIMICTACIMDPNLPDDDKAPPPPTGEGRG